MTTLLEIEKKYTLQTSVEAFMKLLGELGFYETVVEHEADTYYSRPDVDYMQTVECLRIRRKDNYAELTYKPPTITKSDVTVKPETNVRLDSPDTAREAHMLFDAIGMQELVTVDKERHTYIHADETGLSVCVDIVADAGVFVEIEILSEDEASARTRIEALEGTLVLDPNSIVTLPYRDLVMNAQKDKANA